MADAADLAKACIEKYPNAVLYALAPNFRGVENAFNAGIRNISYVISVSESHNKANIREIVGFQTEGHAGYADAGSDIVCAAISVLVINTINSVEQFTDSDCTVTQDEENAGIYFRVNSSKNPKVEIEECEPLGTAQPENGQRSCAVLSALHNPFQ